MRCCSPWAAAPTAAPCATAPSAPKSARRSRSRATPRRSRGSRSNRSTHDGECQLRRVVGADGRGRAYLNGQAVPVQSLRALGELLVDVHGQLEFQSLVTHGLPARDARRQRQARARASPRCARRYADWRALDERARLVRATLCATARPGSTCCGITSRSSAALDPKPRRSGGARRGAQAHREPRAASPKARRRSRRCWPATTAASPPRSRASQSVLRTSCTLDATLGRRQQQLEEAIDRGARGARDAASLRRFARGRSRRGRNGSKPRLAALEAVARKHRVELARTAGPARAARQRSLAELEASALERRRAAAEARGRARHATCRPRATLDRRSPRRGAGARCEGHRARCRGSACPAACSRHASSRTSRRSSRARGNDDVEFLVSANPGQPPRPLAKVASGGELSRISLALQVAAVEAAHLPCLVFDEVDAGVGGAVAEMVGRQLRALAAHGQVLCVTHLPQVASQSDHQLRVSKHVVDGATRTRIEALDEAARVEELARMLGGTQITDAHARTRAGDAGVGAPTRGRRRAAPTGRLRRASAGKGKPRGRNGRAG